MKKANPKSRNNHRANKWKYNKLQINRVTLQKSIKANPKKEKKKNKTKLRL